MPDNIIPFPKKKGKFDIAISEVTGLPISTFSVLNRYPVLRKLIPRFDYLKPVENINKDK